MVGRAKIAERKASWMWAVGEGFVFTNKISSNFSFFPWGYPPLRPDPFVEICRQNHNDILK